MIASESLVSRLINPLELFAHVSPKTWAFYFSQFCFFSQPFVQIRFLKKIRLEKHTSP